MLCNANELLCIILQIVMLWQAAWNIHNNIYFSDILFPPIFYFNFLFSFFVSTEEPTESNIFKTNCKCFSLPIFVVVTCSHAHRKINIHPKCITFQVR